MKYLEQIRHRHADEHHNSLCKWQEKGNIRLFSRIDQEFSGASLLRKLHITYVMNHVRVCGGAKIIIEQANQLVDRGHHVTIICRYPEPNWIEVKAKYVHIPWQARFTEYIDDTDVIVCTVYEQMAECYLSQKAPVVMFEQGDSYLFEFSALDPQLQHQFKKEWTLPVPILSVSSGLSDILKQHFQRHAQILPNAVDRNIFFPRESDDFETRSKCRILLVGQDQIRFKGINDILAALRIVKQTGREFEVVWVSQIKPSIPFSGTLVINPSQKELGEIYRSCDIYVSGSYYESFCLPALEAMTSGCAVVSTRHAGIQEYGKHNYNCLMAEIGNPTSLAEQIIELIDNKNKRYMLIQNGYKTAAQYSWEKTIDKLESYLSGAIQLWNRTYKSVDSLLRIEKIPSQLTREEAIRVINQVQTTMKEEWCLWLIENEHISYESIQQIKRVVAEEIDNVYKLQVHYPNDVPDHPIIRLENRLLKKGQLYTDSVHIGEKLPIKIENGHQLFFVPEWLSVVIKLYREKEFLNMVKFIQNHFSYLSIEEQGLAIKWLVLSLLEMQSFSEAAKVLNESLEIHQMYSDIFYLYARLSILLHDTEMGKALLTIAVEIGEARLYPESFEDIRRVSHMYLAAINGEVSIK
jgi:L-malate glycosyltransferase